MQKVPDPGFRVDRGPVQFGNDWPGTFFRGDQSGGVSDILRAIAKRIDLGDVSPAYARYLRELADEFSECIIRGDRHAP